MPLMRRASDPLAPLRAWWFRRQGLSRDSPPRTIDGCLRQTGWLTTSGSTGVYLSIRARLPGVSRDAIDRMAIDGTTIIEVPGPHARPAVIVPREDLALALGLHLATYQKHAAPLFKSGRLNETALRAVEAQVCRALDEGPLSSAQIRKSITHPDAGELLIGALIGLAVRGIVRRFPPDGRLDSAKYEYELRHPDDRPDLDAEGDDATVLAKGVERFLKRHGPATVDEIAWWGEANKGAVRDALRRLRAEAMPIPGWAKESWLLPDDAPAWRSFKPGGDERVVFLPYRDPFVHSRRGLSVLARRNDAPVLNGQLKRSTIDRVDHLSHHAIVAGGELAGIWEFDPDAQQVVTRLWTGDARLRRRVAEAAGETARFIRQQLGDAPLSAVDPPAKRSKRLAFCRLRVK
jgi:hypothetical protein